MKFVGVALRRFPRKKFIYPNDLILYLWMTLLFTSLRAVTHKNDAGSFNFSLFYPQKVPKVQKCCSSFRLWWKWHYIHFMNDTFIFFIGRSVMLLIKMTQVRSTFPCSIHKKCQKCNPWWKWWQNRLLMILLTLYLLPNRLLLEKMPQVPSNFPCRYYP